MNPLKELQEIHEKFGPIKNINHVHKNKLSPMQNLALFVTNKIGTMGFFFIIFSWTVLWLGWNIFAPGNLRFDPYPAFVLWLFISNLIQIHLMPLIMVGQNIQGQHQELRSQHDYDTDKKAEAEVNLILKQLVAQQKLLEELSKRLEKMEIGKGKDASLVRR